MKKLLYKGIEFDDFQLYNGEPERYGNCNSESLDGFDSVDVYVCPHCIKKYNLYEEADTCVETVERYINGKYSNDMYSTICGVKGCNNKNAFDCYINFAECQIEENKEYLKEKDYQFDVKLCDGMWAGGTYTVKASSESEAQEKALTEICDKLYRALPELDIEVSVELLED